MTLKEKIKNLTWFDLINKVKEILTSLNDSIDKISKAKDNSGGILEAPIDGVQYGRQDGSWTEITGGAQNLDSVLSGGNRGLGKTILLTFDGQLVTDSTEYSYEGLALRLQGMAYPNTKYGISNIETLNTSTGGVLSIFNFSSGRGNFNLPLKTVAQNYTLTTLDDINLLGILAPTYVDNAAAVAGGLAVNRLYKTSTGELRVTV